MSDTEKSTQGGGKAGGGWSDKERLVYMFALLEQSAPKPDYKNTPRPAGRSELACQRIVERLKSTIKDDLVALQSGSYTPDSPTTTKKAATKRKSPAKDKNAAAKGQDADTEGSPKKRGRKKKTEIDAPKKAAGGEVDQDDETMVQSQIKSEMIEQEL